MGDRPVQGFVEPWGILPHVAGSPPFPESVCHRCRHVRLVESGKGSVFLMCREPSLPRYGPQPVRSCPAFAAK
jgi:hypothetical protein